MQTSPLWLIPLQTSLTFAGEQAKRRHVAKEVKPSNRNRAGRRVSPARPRWQAQLPQSATDSLRWMGRERETSHRQRADSESETDWLKATPANDVDAQ